MVVRVDLVNHDEGRKILCLTPMQQCRKNERLAMKGLRVAIAMNPDSRSESIKPSRHSTKSQAPTFSCPLQPPGIGSRCFSR